MTKLISIVSVMLLLLTFSACNTYYHAPISSPLPQSNNVYRPPEDFVLKRTPFTVFEAPTVHQKEILIVIDAGHGGDDWGACSICKPEYHEKSLNLVTARKLNEFLQKMGYQTVMTRSTDEFITLQKRADFANEQDADLFVSVHYNSAPAEKASGIEVFYYKTEQDNSRASESRKLASSILMEITKSTEAKSRGVKHGNYAVIRETKMPAVLIEGGFLTNEDEMEKIKDPVYVKSIAWGIAQGIQAYLNQVAFN